MEIIKLSIRERDHILAGLRALQRLIHDPDLMDIIEGSPMSLEEIDDLCEALNSDGLTPELGDVLNVLSAAQDPALKPYVENADQMNYVREGEVEVDENAIVSKGDDAGAYVLGWIWVDNETAGIESEPEDEEA